MQNLKPMSVSYDHRLRELRDFLYDSLRAITAYTIHTHYTRPLLHLVTHDIRISVFDSMVAINKGLIYPPTTTSL